MFKEGLKEEVDGLIKMGYKKENPGMQAIGYREFFMNLDSDEAIKEKIKSDSHAYAKKQYVFMKEIPGARTFNLNETDSIQDLCRELSLYFCQSILSQYASQGQRILHGQAFQKYPEGLQLHQEILSAVLLQNL